MGVITAFESFKHLKLTCVYSIRLVHVFDMHSSKDIRYLLRIYSRFSWGGVEGAHHLAPWLNFDTFIQTDNRSDGSERKGTAPSFHRDETGNWPPKAALPSVTRACELLWQIPPNANDSFYLFPPELLNQNFLVSLLFLSKSRTKWFACGLRAE